MRAPAGGGGRRGIEGLAVGVVSSEPMLNPLIEVKEPIDFACEIGGVLLPGANGVGDLDAADVDPAALRLLPDSTDFNSDVFATAVPLFIDGEAVLRLAGTDTCADSSAAGESAKKKALPTPPGCKWCAGTTASFFAD